QLQALAFDPLMLARNSTATVFPAPTVLPTQYAAGNNPPFGIPRVTFWSNTRFPSNNAATSRLLLPEQIFRDVDDLVFVLPKDRDANPIQQLRVPLGQLAANQPKYTYQRQSEGKYSWMATVVPDPNIRPYSHPYLPTATDNLGIRDLLVTVSVAVFYNRNL